ncbi:MAG: MFS transporter [Candidatus Lokiarchaeota archaeon]|nr:MFS transporter [Candidatus Lokiarchaeota archaeon]
MGTLKSKKVNNNQIMNNITTPDFIAMIRIIFWNSMGFFFFSFLIPYVTIKLLGVSRTELGLAFSIQTVGGLLSSPIVGYLTDRISKKLLVLIGSFGRATAYIVMYFGIIMSNYITFTGGMFVLGFFVGFFWTPLDTLISEKSSKMNRSFAFGKRAAMIGWGNFVGSIISVTVFLIFSIVTPEVLFLVYSPLLIFAASNILGGIIFHRKVDEELTFEKHIFNIYPSNVEPTAITKEPVLMDSQETPSEKITRGFFFGFLILTLAFMTSNMNASLAYPYFQGYLTDVLLVENAILVMLIYFPSQVVSLLLAPKLGKIADKINPIIGIAFVSGFGSLVTFLIINSTSGLVFGILLLFDSTFAWGGNVILQNIVSRISKYHRGKVFGATQWLSLLGAILGPILGGIAWDNFGPKSPFIISIFIELSVIPLYAIAITYLKKYMAEKIE